MHIALHLTLPIVAPSYLHYGLEPCYLAPRTGCSDCLEVEDEGFLVGYDIYHHKVINAE
jgi:hypothetical protein